MLHVKNLDEGLEVFKALGSELRINIIKLLQENHEMNMNELATSLGITMCTDQSYQETGRKWNHSGYDRTRRTWKSENL